MAQLKSLHMSTFEKFHSLTDGHVHLLRAFAIVKTVKGMLRARMRLGRTDVASAKMT